MNQLIKYSSLFLILFIGQFVFGQKTIVKGIVTDKSNGEPMPFVKVYFLDTKSGTYTDTLGNYSLG